MCGEHRLENQGTHHRRGSSPHVRGALSAGALPQIAVGIIPACAGSTYFGRWRGTALRDHPRMCGEHIYMTDPDVLGPGSSPHVRGARSCSDCGTSRRGIIPACAGSTRLCSASELVSRDHPRMCGEHSPQGSPKPPDWGSSPHVRGAHFQPSLHFQASGIIPACAGSTSSTSNLTCGSRDHPRMCGEHVRRRR